MIINYANSKINDNDFTSVANEIIQRNDVDITLDLSRNLLTSKSNHLLAYIIKNKSLKSLKIGFNQFDQTTWALLGETLAQSSLQEIDVGYNNLGDAGIGLLLKNLSNHPTLHAICLANNNIGDAGAIFIAIALRNNKTLKKNRLML